MFSAGAKDCTPAVVQDMAFASKVWTLKPGAKLHKASLKELQHVQREFCKRVWLLNRITGVYLSGLPGHSIGKEVSSPKTRGKAA